MSTLPGTTLSGRYRLEAKIGAGGMSTVYRAFDEILQRRVAIKLMNAEITADSDQLERFRREARAVAQLSHPHIVSVIDAGDDSDPQHPRPYIVFEYVEGETLKERIRRLGRLPVPEAVAYAIEIARALGAAHARHIVHRDVKPQNVLIDEEGSAKVTDFGIARTLDEEGLTADGRVLGTTDYVSPEQALGQPVTGQSDLYSLGIVLYEMLTGEVPFRGENQVAVAMKHVRDPLPDVRIARPEVSATLATVLDNATAKRLEERYADDAELIADLEDVLTIEAARTGDTSGETTTVLRTLPTSAQRRVPLAVRRRHLTAAGAVLLLVALAALGIWLATRAHRGVAPPGPSTRSRHPISLCQSCAAAYNPDGLGGNIAQNNSSAGLAIDGNPATAWDTEDYFTGSLQKAGVGIYVDASPGTAAAEIVLQTTTPGWATTIYASRQTPDPRSFAASGWVKVGSAARVAARQTIQLRTRGRRYDYYLVWITRLAPHEDYVAVNEITLYS
jgi:serine/threonine protein kinase